ncbi:hypothetical protein WJX84_010603 [Apatococcus fuscideae]|uniref:protein acetyllysine N-acetyltransferase n=1 Tax=Apatococcus fuscideae TaxID=2026836 RepID=A0AAW1SVR0_9CHLO
MSLGYAQKLSYKEDLGGSFGKPEVVEPGLERLRKALLLADWIKEAESVIVFTGAGISTSCGIPDFRGPQGVWTLQKQGLPFEAPANAFALAKPSLTHQALVALRACGKLSFVVSQNVDNLHLRSGLDAAALAELHGNCFIEQCHTCRVRYAREFEIETVGFKPTGRRCTANDHCRGRLRDMVLDWDDALPEDDLEASEQHAGSAQVALCLGTSLQVRPANSLPLRTVKAGGKLAIVNLQKTCKDRQADLVLHAKCDDVMRTVIEALGLQLPVYRRVDTYILQCSQDTERGS